MSETEPVLYSCDAAGVATLTLNRPEVRNALDPALLDRLEKLLGDLHRAGHIRAVILKGAGEGFMAGGDISYFHEQRRSGPNPTLFGQLLGQINTVTRLLRTLPVPVVAAVQGACAGYGLSLMLAADLAIAADTACFTFAYPRLGQSPDGAASWQLVRTIGLRRAMGFALLDEPMDAQTALSLGLVNRVVAASDLEQTVQSVADKLANGPALAYGSTKLLFQLAAESAMGTALEAEAEEFTRLSSSADFLEGITAFKEKRAAKFRGE